MQIYIFICRYVYKHEYIYIYKYTYLSVDMYMNIYCACSTVSSLYKVASHWETHSAHCNTLKHPAIQFLGLLKLSFTLLSLLMCVFDWLIDMCVFDWLIHIRRAIHVLIRRKPHVLRHDTFPKQQYSIKIRRSWCATWLMQPCDMTHLYVWHDSRCVRCDTFPEQQHGSKIRRSRRATWLIHLCDMTHSTVWHDACIRATWLINMCDMTYSPGNSMVIRYDVRNMRHDSCICVTWLIYTCDMAHSYVSYDAFTHVQHDSFICVMWLVYMTHCPDKKMDVRYDDRNDAHVCRCNSVVLRYDVRVVRHDSFICVTWLICTCDMTHWYVRCVTFPKHQYGSKDTKFVMCDMTSSSVSCDSFTYMQHDLFICMIWLVYMTHSPNKRMAVRYDDRNDTHVRHNPYNCVTWLIHMCDVTRFHYRSTVG